VTRIRIPAPDIEADVSAEQVVAYLLASGWAENMDSIIPHEPGPHPFERGGHEVYFADGWDGVFLSRTIKAIARAEQRHPSAVLADIVGPARGVDGAVCAVGMDDPWLWGGCNRLDGQCRDSAAHGAGESEEQR